MKRLIESLLKELIDQGIIIKGSDQEIDQDRIISLLIVDQDISGLRDHLLNYKCCNCGLFNNKENLTGLYWCAICRSKYPDLSNLMDSIRGILKDQLQRDLKLNDRYLLFNLCSLIQDQKIKDRHYQDLKTDSGVII